MEENFLKVLYRRRSKGQKVFYGRSYWKSYVLFKRSSLEEDLQKEDLYERRPSKGILKKKTFQMSSEKSFKRSSEEEPLQKVL